jgi:predicted metal-dependent phosphoesterase TrpH
MIDLHVHSCFSDGDLTPEDLVQLAARSEVSALALTDHDTTQGLKPFLAACRATSGTPAAVEGLTGVEISADVPHGSMHILGYLFDPESQPLQRMLERIRTGRDERNLIILRQLRALGMALDEDALHRIAGEGVLGRPHIAQAMVAQGFVTSTSQAFSRFLARGKPGYAERYRPQPEEALRTVREAGGVPVLAHPVSLKVTRSRLVTIVEELVRHGLGGIEAYYPEHAPDVTADLVNTARMFGIVATGGSDFHGQGNPLIRLGRGFGALVVPIEAVEQLRRRAGSP